MFSDISPAVSLREAFIVLPRLPGVDRGAGKYSAQGVRGGHGWANPMTHGRAVIELDRRRRDDHPVTLLVLVLFLGFILGMIVGSMIVTREERYETIPSFPREESSFRYEET